MKKQFQSIGVHWYSRKQTLDECIQSIIQFLSELENQNPTLFGVWYKKGKSKKVAIDSQFVIDYHNLKGEIAPKLQNDSFPETAFNLSIWNGKENDEEAMSISFSLGSEEANFFTNNCVIELPYGGEERKFYDDISKQEKLIVLLKNHWKPEWMLIDGKRVDL